MHRRHVTTTPAGLSRKTGSHFALDLRQFMHTRALPPRLSKPFTMLCPDTHAEDGALLLPDDGGLDDDL